MNYYPIALFFHIVGALGFFVALGVEWTGLWQMRSATTAEQVRLWMRVFNGTRRLGTASALTILIFGFYMAATTWGGVAWIIVALGAIVLTFPLTAAFSEPRMTAMQRALPTEKGPLSRGFQNLVNNPLLRISIQTRIAIALGIVFLMTVKPGWGGSLLTIGIAIVLGLVSALPMPRHARAQQGSVH